MHYGYSFHCSRQMHPVLPGAGTDNGRGQEEISCNHHIRCSKTPDAEVATKNSLPMFETQGREESMCISASQPADWME